MNEGVLNKSQFSRMLNVLVLKHRLDRQQATDRRRKAALNSLAEDSQDLFEGDQRALRRKMKGSDWFLVGPSVDHHGRMIR
jgi:hypothetical protein